MELRIILELIRPHNDSQELIRTQLNLPQALEHPNLSGHTWIDWNSLEIIGLAASEEFSLNRVEHSRPLNGHGKDRGKRRCNRHDLRHICARSHHCMQARTKWNGYQDPRGACKAISAPPWSDTWVFNLCCFWLALLVHFVACAARANCMVTSSKLAPTASTPMIQVEVCLVAPQCPKRLLQREWTARGCPPACAGPWGQLAKDSVVRSKNTNSKECESSGKSF